MVHRLIQYEVDGEEKWAIWSTITDSFIVYDGSAEEIVEYEAEQAYQRQKEKSEEHVQKIRDGEDPYYGGGRPTEEDLQKLKEEY